MILEFDITKTCLWVCLFEAEIINPFKIFQNSIFIGKIWEDLQNFSRSDSLHRTHVLFYDSTAQRCNFLSQ